MNDSISRRDLLLRSLMLGGVSLIPAVLVACGKKELACTDTAGLTADETQMRTMLAYVDKATDASKSCQTCQMFKPAAPDQCGGCTILKGPIHPGGTCKSWVAKA